MKDNFKRLLSTLLAFFMVAASFTFTAFATDYPDISAVSSATISEIKVNNPLDYTVGEDIVFKFQLKSGSAVVTAPYLSYSAVMDDGRTLKGYVTPTDGTYTVTLEGGLLRPGFVLMTVNACNENKATISSVASYLCGAGADIDKIHAIYGVPDEYDTYGDLDAFWKTTLAPLSEEGGEATIQYIYYCGAYTFSGVTYDCYELEINCPKDSYYDYFGTGISHSWGGTNHVSAYLTIPQGKTGLGLQLLYKGHDWISASGSQTSIEPQSGICSPNKITLSVSPHSIPAPHNVAEADKDSEWVENGAYIANYYRNFDGGYLRNTYGYTNTHGKWNEENENPNTTYFKYMLMRDVQAVNFLTKYFSSTGVDSTVNGVDTSLWKGLWDGVNVKTDGGSQGGYQAISVAGLSSVVNEVNASVPWFGDQGVRSEDSDRYTPSFPNPSTFFYRDGLRYIDPANLASRISTNCKVTINAGLIDTLCPPSTVMSIYALMDCNVTLTFHQNKGHSVGGTVIYTQTISKEADTAEKSHTVNYVSEFDDTFKSDFAAAWDKVCGENVVTVDIYKSDRNTTTDFAALASSSSADAIGIVLVGDDLTKINEKLAEIYALHNDVNSKIWVISNDGTADGETSAITLDACMNGGDRPTGGVTLALCGTDGVKGQTFVLSANEPHALIPTPLWVSGKGILMNAENITFENGLLSSTGDDGSVSFSVPSCSVEYETVGVGDAEAYGNIEGVGLWIYKDGVLTIKGAGEMPDYASAGATPWTGKSITEIVITEGITKIGSYAFAEAESNATVRIPKSVTAISASAVASGSTIYSYDNAYAKTFASENSFTFVNLGATGTMGTDLTWHLDIKTGVFTVSGTGADLFAQDDNGNKVDIAAGWTEALWADAQYYSYRNDVKKLVIEAPIKTIQTYCLGIMNNCTTLELPESYTGSNTIAFHGMDSMNCIYTKGQTPESGTANLSNLTVIGSYFMVGVPVEKIILNDSVTSIGTQTFYGCKKLTNINIPSALSSIGHQAFYNCSSLTSLELPASLTTINANAFEGCTGIKTLTVKNATLDMSFAAKLTNLNLIIAPEGSAAETYANANGITFEPYEEVIASGDCGTDLYWKLIYENGTGVLKIYGSGTTVVSGSGGWSKENLSVFYPYREQINRIEFCDSVATIAPKCFYYLPGLKEVELTKNITTIGDNGFGNCANLSTIYVKGNTPETGTYDLSYVTSMTGGYQFDGAGKTTLKNIKLSSSLTGAIGDKFVSYNSSLEEISFPKGVTSLANRAIHCCTKLKTLKVYGENTAIGENFLKVDNDTTSLTVIYGIEGSPAQTYAENNSIEFKTLSSTDSNIENMPIGDNVLYRLIKNSDGEDTYTMEIYGEGTKAYAADSNGNKVNMNWNLVGDRSYNDYASRITKIKISTGTITEYQGYMFKGLAVTTVELAPEVTFLGSSLFNSIGTVDTVYISGNEPVEGVADLSNITTLGTYTFVDQKFKEIILSDSLKTIPNYCFGTQDYTVSALEKVVIPASVTSIEVNAFRDAKNLVYIEFKGTGFAYTASSFTNIAPRATVIAPDGSAGEALASSLGLQFIDSAKLHSIEAYYVNNNSVILLDKVSENDYTAYCTGSDTYFFMGYDSYDNAIAVTARPWEIYKTEITKAVYVNPSFTKIDSSFARHASLTTVEIPSSVTGITDSAFNGAALTTLYVTGNEPVEGVVDLTNITSLGSMSMASCKAHTIKLSDDLTGTWGNNLFYKCENLKYIRIPKGVTGSTDDPFNEQTRSLTTVLVENPDFVFSDKIFGGSTNITTIIGYSGSTAETFASNKGLKFIPLDRKDILTFDSFQIREEGYNGLRSLFITNLANASTLETSEAELSGLKVIEIGGMMAATDNLPTASTELTLEKNASGKYASPYDFAKVIPVYQNGERVGKVISETDGIAKFACTVRDFTASNYDKNIAFRGYVIYADKEGNEYVAYADLTDSEGATHNVASLETICQKMIDEGRDLSANICWQHIQEFKKENESA